jgi:hypothetical protein
MSLLSDVVGIANEVTKSLGFQAKVTVRKTGQDNGTGDSEVTTAKYDAVIEKRIRQVRDSTGQLVASSSNVMFLDPTIKISMSDQIILPDGTGGPIITISSPVDTSGNLLTQVYLG